MIEGVRVAGRARGPVSCINSKQARGAQRASGGESILHDESHAALILHNYPNLV